jgi:hypothetical protein
MLIYGCRDDSSNSGFRSPVDFRPNGCEFMFIFTPRTGFGCRFHFSTVDALETQFFFERNPKNPEARVSGLVNLLWNPNKFRNQKETRKKVKGSAHLQNPTDTWNPMGLGAKFHPWVRVSVSKSTQLWVPRNVPLLYWNFVLLQGPPHDILSHFVMCLEM